MLLLNTYLYIELPDLPKTYDNSKEIPKFKWIKNIGLNIFNYVSIKSFANFKANLFFTDCLEIPFNSIYQHNNRLSLRETVHSN